MKTPDYAAQIDRLYQESCDAEDKQEYFEAIVEINIAQNDEVAAELFMDAINELSVAEAANIMRSILENHGCEYLKGLLKKPVRKVIGLEAEMRVIAKEERDEFGSNNDE